MVDLQAYLEKKLRTVAGAIGLVGECDDIEEGYSIGIVIKQPKDDGIYSAADDESLAALIISWINNKYISYVADSDGKIIACKSVTNKTGEEGFIVNLTKNTSDNTYKVDLAITGESSINRFPIMHDNSARVQAYRFNIRYAVSSHSIRPLL